MDASEGSVETCWKNVFQINRHVPLSSSGRFISIPRGNLTCKSSLSYLESSFAAAAKAPNKNSSNVALNRRLKIILVRFRFFSLLIKIQQFRWKYNEGWYLFFSSASPIGKRKSWNEINWRWTRTNSINYRRWILMLSLNFVLLWFDYDV